MQGGARGLGLSMTHGDVHASLLLESQVASPFLVGFICLLHSVDFQHGLVRLVDEKASMQFVAISGTDEG